MASPDGAAADDPDDAAADISALLESATLTDDEEADITNWECGICQPPAGARRRRQL